MNKIKFSRAVALFVMMVMLGGTLFASVVRVAYGASLSITPPLIRIALVPGDIWHSTFQVTNSGSDAVTVMIETAHVDTKDAGSKFTPVFLPPEDRRGVLSGWITMGASEARIEAGETKSIPLTIIIPKDASPGGHYATILVGLKPDAVSSSRTAIGVTSKLAAIVAVRVAGDVIESMGIKEFSTEHVFYPDFPVRLTLWMKNLGNTHVEPNVIVRVTNFWGNLVKEFTIEQGHDIGMILPQHDRKTVLYWSGVGVMGGYYRAEIEINYADGKVLRDAIGFIVISSRFLFIFLFGIGIFITLMIWLTRKIVLHSFRKNSQL